MTGMAMKKIQPRYRSAVKKIVWDKIPTEVKLIINRYSTGKECQQCGGNDYGCCFLLCEGGHLAEQRR